MISELSCHWPLLARIRDRVTELHVAAAKATLAAGGRVERLAAEGRI
ncbi:hypothetical protein PV341_12880 [Streptomyces sp. PA03-1a]|nr:hypothetical protein [Streptomyces sp. PA03-1a]MDX2816235.1 hypothetical protein [Streptomyces sp. PA03-5A]